MASLLIRSIRYLVTCDDKDQLLEDVDLYCEDGFIRQIGPHLDITADRTIDASHMLCYPGLVNTHHHLYQVFSRNLPQVQNMELFDWLKTLYEIWKNLDEDVIRLSSLTGMGELMKHGCTTCFDHHYVFPTHAGDLIGAQFAAADTLGIRMYASRGSMDLSVKDGGLPPDSVVQTVDEIMADSARVIEKYHDKSFGAMHRVALAPCSPFSVSADLLRESAVLAREYGVRLHTHLCETKDEENFMLQREGIRPLEYMERLGWTGSDVWFAHGIHFNDEELRVLAKTGTGVAHCPISNMKLSSGIARIPEMLELAKKHSVALLRSNETTCTLMGSLISVLNLELAPRITRHGVLVEVYGEGILILGDSGIGKSELAIELVKRGHRLVADDAVELRKVSNRQIMGTAPENIRHFIELRGIGIVNVARVFGVGAVKLSESLDLVVQLEAWDPTKNYQRTGLENEYYDILGVSIPSTSIPVSPGRNLAVVLETAAINNRQKKMGYNAARELLIRLGLDDKMD